MRKIEHGGQMVSVNTQKLPRDKGDTKMPRHSQ
jgi:hypothetical protein